jgi:hypothetical protein
MKELEDELEERVSELRQERDEIAFNAIKHVRELHIKNTHWPQALISALASITGEDIASDFLHLLLPHPFSSMRNFYQFVRPPVFVAVYTGLSEEVSQFAGELRMVDVLRWIHGIPTSTNLPTDPLSRIVLLDEHMLKEDEAPQKRDSWVLLAFRFLSKMVISNDWPVCCVAAVHLAHLDMEYRMYNKNE